MPISVRLGLGCSLGIIAVSMCVSSVQAQTSCGIQHREPGASICFPDASLTAAASFHLSAQGNALTDQKITGYQVTVDGKLVYEEREPNPVRELSIETTIKG